MYPLDVAFVDVALHGRLAYIMGRCPEIIIAALRLCVVGCCRTYGVAIGYTIVGPSALRRYCLRHHCLALRYAVIVNAIITLPYATP